MITDVICIILPWQNTAQDLGSVKIIQKMDNYVWKRWLFSPGDGQYLALDFAQKYDNIEEKVRL